MLRLFESFVLLAYLVPIEDSHTSSEKATAAKKPGNRLKEDWKQAAGGKKENGFRALCEPT